MNTDIVKEVLRREVGAEEQWAKVNWEQDPSVSHCVAVRLTMKNKRTVDFVLHSRGPALVGVEVPRGMWLVLGHLYEIEEVEFSSWPPRSGKSRLDGYIH